MARADTQSESKSADPISTETQRIQQSLETENSAGLHAVLESLAGKANGGKMPSDASEAGDDSTSLDAQGLAALFAALPLTMVSTGSASNNAGVGNTAGGSKMTSAALQSMGLATTAAQNLDDANELTSIAQQALTTASQQPGASTRVNAASQQTGKGSSPGADGNPASWPGNLAPGNFVPGTLAPGNLVPGTAPVSGPPMPQGDLTTAGKLDAMLATNGDPNSLNLSTLSGDRADPGSLAGLASSLSNVAVASTPAAAATPAAITASVQSPQWPASFGQQVLQMYQRGDQQMSLRLHPQELGPLSISLTVQDQQAQLQILSAHASVRAAVETAIPQLRQALADSGIALGEAMVGDQGLFQQNQFQQDQSSGDGQPRRASIPGGSLLTATPLDVGDDSSLRQVDLMANGNINLYA